MTSPTHSNADQSLPGSIADQIKQLIYAGEFKAGDHILVDEGKSDTLDFRKGDRPPEDAATVH